MTAKELLLEKKRRRLSKFLKRRVGFKPDTVAGRKLIEGGFEEGWIVNVRIGGDFLDGRFQKKHLSFSVLIGSPGRWQFTILKGDQIFLLPPKDGEEQWLAGF